MDHRSQHDNIDYTLVPVGFIESSLTDRSAAPRQGNEGAPEAWISINEDLSDALHGTQVGDQIIILTWLHESERDVLKVHPRSDPNNPLTGVFATRSPDRPNPIGMHPVTVLEIRSNRIRVSGIEAIDGTPVVDIKPVI